MDRTAKGLRARVRGWRDGKGTDTLEVDTGLLLDISARQALALRRRRRG
jgi:hypothetical protein